MPKAIELGVASVQEAVEHVYGLSGDVVGNEYRILCVNPRHNETNPSCSINLESGYWHCFSCGVGGDLAELGVRVLRQDRDQVEELLRPSSMEGMIHAVRNRIAALQPQRVRREAPRPLGGPYEDGPLLALRQRGFTQETLQRWGIRFVAEEKLMGHKGEFTIASSIGIPIRGDDGTLLAWCYRRTNSSPGWQPRYLYDREISHLWFGMQHHAQQQHVTIVEGAVDAMWMDQCGFPALGLLGAGMAGGKKNTLKSKILRLQRFKSLTLLGDRDSGGEAWVNLVGETLGTRMPIKVGLYSSWMRADDPQELMGMDLEILMERALPWARYKMRRGRRSA